MAAHSASTTPQSPRTQGPTPVPLAAGLYVAATPLGNLGDMTLRGLDTLSRVTAIACEDTRVTADLLRLLGLAVPTLISVREHNEKRAAEGIVARIARGEAVAYVSDAGTPGVSDPGARLVASVRAAGHVVIPVPGPSAVTAALSAAGLAGTAFTFIGFIPRDRAGRQAWLEALARCPETTVFFESPHRIEATLLALADAFVATEPKRRVVVCRELTKRHEEIVSLEIAALAPWVEANASRVRGEFVVLVEGTSIKTPLNALNPTLLMRMLVTELPPARAAKVAARLTGLPRDTLYALAETLAASAPPR
ncbi:MAG: 16S rRNA (cytidine(1402)-2'-O)-methyltransferase [Casimicrobiaceae bacterium]